MSGKRRRLGRGLGDLLAGDQEPKAETGTDADSGVGTVSVRCLKANRHRHQPRGHLDEAEIEELAASLRAHGVIQLCDPACGSGNFLSAAGRRIAHRPPVPNPD